MEGVCLYFFLFILSFWQFGPVATRRMFGWMDGDDHNAARGRNGSTAKTTSGWAPGGDGGGDGGGVGGGAGGVEGGVRGGWGSRGSRGGRGGRSAKWFSSVDGSEPGESQADSNEGIGCCSSCFSLVCSYWMGNRGVPVYGQWPVDGGRWATAACLDKE